MGFLRQLDDCDDSPHVREAVDKIFNSYGTGEAVLSKRNSGYDKAMIDMAEYVRTEWEARNQRLVAEGKRSMGNLPDQMLKDWVVGSIDPNGDGEITKEEALRGF